MKTTRHDSFAAYVLPSVLAFALSGLYTIVDGFFIGQSLGDLGLAAITLAYPAAALLQAVGTGIGLAGAIRCTILQARGEEQTPRTCFSGTVLLLLATSAAFAAVLLGLLGPVLTVLGAQDEARPLAAEYIRVIAYGTAFQILATGLVPFIRNLGGSAFAMVAMGTGFVTNIALDYLFVWEFHWGMAGGAWATVIGLAATMLLAIVGFMILYRICQPMNALRMIVWIGCVIGLLGCSIFLPQLFAITGMSRKCIMLFVIFSIATEPVLRYLTKLIEWLRKQYIKFIKNPIKEFKGKAAD